MKKQEYKNSIVTKKKIASAYLSLLIENPNNINVTEIVKKAGIYRGTFYIHFENVKMVEQFIEKELAENFLDLETDFRLVQIDKTPEIIIDKLNEILKRDLVFYRLFITAACNTNLMETIKKSILESLFLAKCFKEVTETYPEIHKTIIQNHNNYYFFTPLGYFLSRALKKQPRTSYMLYILHTKIISFIQRIRKRNKS